MNIEQFIDKHIRADVTALITGDNTFYNSALVVKAIALSAPFLNYEAAARAAGWEVSKDTETDAYRFKAVHWVEDSGLCDTPEEAWRLCCKSQSIAPHEIPIIGHYIVTSELADKLEARGERVERDFGGMIVWARKLHLATNDGAIASFPLDRDPVLLAIFEAEPQPIYSATYETAAQRNASIAEGR